MKSKAILGTWVWEAGSLIIVHLKKKIYLCDIELTFPSSVSHYIKFSIAAEATTWIPEKNEAWGHRQKKSHVY